MPSNAKRTSVQYWPYAVVASISGVVFAWFQAVPQLQDPDSFYHIRLTWLMLQSGVLSEFPWLHYSSLAQQFTDHHLLYHLILMPFFLLMNPIVAAKVAQALSIVVLMIVLFHQLQRWRLPYVLPAMLVLMGTTPFLIRLQLIKASVVAIIILLLITVNLLERRYGRVMVLSLLYSWVHGGFVLALVVAVVIWLAQIFTTLYQERRFCWVSLQPVMFVGMALSLGVIANPYFPNNLSFYWQQLVQIGIINYRDEITVGAEWYPFALPDFVSVLSILGIAVVGAVGVFIYRRRVYWRDTTAVSLGLLMVIFAIATLRSRRYIEYLTPLTWLWSCYILLPYLASAHWKKLQHKLQQQLGKLYYVLLIYFMLTIPGGIILAVVRAYHVTQDGIPLDTLQQASYYVRDYVPAGTVVFHGSWDEFPMLFFHNPTDYYVIGLDPTFMYLYDREQYHHWRDLSAGKSKQSSAQDIKAWFDTRYVILQRRAERTKLLQAYLLRDPMVKTVYRDDSSIVFELL